MTSPCIFVGCVSTDRHWHGGFPGGYDNPDDPTGPPIPFTSEPAPGVRDYNGALLGAEVTNPFASLVRNARRFLRAADRERAAWAHRLDELAVTRALRRLVGRVRS